ncbi:MAG: AbrB/MazE/SpoVT family DNA-binding domain-containing protein [Anaerolineae bacterium]|nr:AbrB/MazE/SpoVT family DNA-binding domain-containing protein [Ardenticatenia bacterium]MBK8539677.1 AbrB/MazE/SpoVT family DNA-binding domain-containing protein [Ardenticatenia bacterium]HQZ71466.1 AbrB/MazE/SpoVT family DNA-binding domain-containing protein [Anaerolineae bacterium]HRA20941.1 AbrB/MazE/SpoVT family DNA-binding domain-containing protein [Anaerolineae bacterium]
MRTRLIGIGNSRGIRLPKPLIEQVGLGDEVDLRVEDGNIVISAVRAPRAGWAEAAARSAATEGSALLDPPTPTRFDESEWQW